MKRYVLTTSIAFIWAGIAWASNPDRVSLTIYGTGQPGSVPTTMYRPTPGVTTEPYGTVPGFAVVKQERSVELNAGHDHVRFTDVTALIDPTTVSFDSLTDPAGTRVLDQDYRFDLVDTRQLLDRYVDQEITVHQGLGDDHSTFTGVLLSARDGLLLKGSNGDVQNFRSYSRIEFPELPNGLVTKPTLVWNLTTRTSGEHRVRVTYQTEGITWWADYILTYQEGEDANACSVDVSAWVSIVNRSGASFADAGLKLIAGDVNRVSQPAVRTELARTLALAEDVSSGFTEKPFFEYHLYTLDRNTSLSNNSTKQIELFPPVRNVACNKELVYYGTPGFQGHFPRPAIDRNLGIQTNKEVDVYLHLDNSTQNRLGVPLPGGRVRVNKLDPSDDTLEFIGEDTIDHTPKDEEVIVKLGNAFDVIGERKQLDFRTDNQRRWIEEDIEIEIRNRKLKPVTVTIKENLYRWINWQIDEASHDYEKQDARTIHFPVRLPGDSQTTVRYTVRYTW